MLPARSFLVAMAILSLATIAQADEGKVTGRSSYLMVNGRTYGFCGMTLLEIDRRPAHPDRHS